MAARPVIAFLTDVNVPDSIGTYLRRRGHDVVRVREIMAADSADPVVAEAAMQGGRVLVSWDKDFNHQRFLKARFKSLHRVAFSCPETEAGKRLRAVIDRIEYEYARTTKAKPLLFKVGRDKVLIRC